MVIPLILMLSVAALPAAADVSGARITRIVESPALGDESAVHIMTVGGENIFSYRADEPRVPASTMKIVTAATSLYSLGPRRVFPTMVQQGDNRREIHLVGGGDPMLSGETLERLAEETAENLRSTKSMKVVVYADTSLFPSHSDAPGWVRGDFPRYAAAVEPLARLGVYSAEPWHDALTYFAQSLRTFGIKAKPGGVRETPEEDAYVLAATVGPTVHEAVGVMLRDSENNVAEVLFRHVALSQGEEPTWRGSSKAAEAVLDDMGFPASNQTLVDGSGLSPRNRLSARFLTGLLASAAPGQDGRLSELRNLLPISGVSGTLTYRFTGPAACARGEVLAKTGSLTGVNTLAGLTQTRGGDWRAFAVLVNGWNGAGTTWAETSSTIDAIAAATFGCLKQRR